MKTLKFTTDEKEIIAGALSESHSVQGDFIFHNINLFPRKFHEDILNSIDFYKLASRFRNLEEGSEIKLGQQDLTLIKHGLNYSKKQINGHYESKMEILFQTEKDLYLSTINMIDEIFHKLAA